MKSMKCVTFVVQKILFNLFSMQKVWMLITADVSKIKKSAHDDFTFIFDVLSENVITFARLCLYPTTKNIVNLRKTFFFKNEAACTSATVRIYFMPQNLLYSFILEHGVC